MDRKTVFMTLKASGTEQGYPLMTRSEGCGQIRSDTQYHHVSCPKKNTVPRFWVTGTQNNQAWGCTGEHLVTRPNIIPMVTGNHLVGSV